jgi:competence protein ComEA
MAIEDFEWRGDEDTALGATVRTDSATSGGATARLWRRITGSVWLEPVLKLAGMAVLLGVLAAIGVVATTYAKPGLALPDGSRQLADALGTSWLKPVAGQPASSVAGTPAAPALAGGQARDSSAASAASGHGPGEVAAASENSAASDTKQEPPPKAGITAEGKVILNAASAEELTKLPGVGMKRAQAIVALRAKLKRFKHPSDLLRVKGIGPRGLQRMLPHLVLDA